MRRHGRLRRKEIKKQRRIIALSLVGVTFLLASGYAAFSTSLNINAKGNMKAPTNVYVSGNGSDANGDGTIENPYKTIAKAYNEAPPIANINLTTDITVTDTISFNQNKTITLTSYNSDRSIIRNNSFKNYLISQSAGEVRLKNIKIDGNEVGADNGLLLVNGSGKLKILDGTVITNSYVIGPTCGVGIAINSNATLEMEGGSIEKNTIYLDPDVNKNSNGGGICAKDNSSIIMKGGSISENSSLQGGGIMLYSHSSLIMNGGTIDNNTAQYSAGGVYIFGYSSMVMTGGIINNNSAGRNGGGIDLECNGTTICPSLSITNGKISNNVSVRSGGGICITKNSTTSSAVAEIGGVTLEGNTSNIYGGAIYNNGILTITNDITVNNNTAVTGNNLYNETGATCSPTNKCELLQNN